MAHHLNRFLLRPCLGRSSPGCTGVLWQLANEARVCAGAGSGTGSDASSSGAAVAAAVGAALALPLAVAAAEDPATQQEAPSRQGVFSWFQRQQPSSPGRRTQQQQQQQQARGPPGVPPESGAIAALDERGLTNHPLDYNPITNEHTAAMTLAKQAAMDYYQRGKYPEAEKRFQEALAEAQLGFPPDDPHIPSAMNNLAEFYRNTRQYSKAQELYQQAIDQLIDIFGEKHWMVASAMCNLGLLLEEQGKYKEAQRVLERTLELRRQLFSANTHPYADCAALLARVMLEAGGGQEDKAIALYSKAIQIIEDTGTPILQWLLAKAQAQMDLAKPKQAIATLQKACDIMVAMKTQEDAQGVASNSSSSSSSSSTSKGGKSEATQLAKAKLMMQASEVNEKLVDALVADGQLQEARQRMTACVEARMHMFGGHLLVAKSMSRLAQLLLLPPRDPDAAQQAVHFASGAVTIARNAIKLAGKPGSLVTWLFLAGSAADKVNSKLQASLQLGRAYQVLAQAHEAEGNPQLAIEVLRRAVEVLRKGQQEGHEEVALLAKKVPEESPVMDKLAGLLLDLKLLQLDLLEALAGALRQQVLQGTGSSLAKLQQQQQQQQQGLKASPVQAGSGDTSEEEIRMLLVEAETIAGELYGVN